MTIKYVICKRQELCDLYLDKHNEWIWEVKNAKLFSTKTGATKKMNVYLDIPEGYYSPGVNIEEVFI